MKNQKPLSEHQKWRLGVAIEALSNPIFSTEILNAPGVQLFSNTPCADCGKSVALPVNFDSMRSAEIPYTKPHVLNKGP